MGLQQFEERLERLVEGTLAKPFRSNLQPIEIGRKMTREMDLHRRVGVHGLIAPNVFSVTLASADVDRFANFIDALSRELADAAREHARIEGYTFVGPVDVQIFEGTKLRPGRFSITAEVVEGAEAVAFAELVLPDGNRVQVGTDPNVSRRHAELRRVGDAVVVTDLGSTNGTRVNGTTVREQHLASGDEISVGSTTLVFELS